ncbi:phosphatase PAP2 family protein [bacterium]|nr:MAG: phosphatase PAP2 family protein [bacterium]
MIRTLSSKKLFRNLIPLFLAATLMGGHCRADEAITLPQGVDFSILPPPPVDDSPAGLADLSVLLYVQANRTPEQIAFAKKMESPSVFEMGREFMGPWFTRENLPKTADILRDVTKVADKVKEDAKKNWQRPRPYVRSQLVSPVVGKPGDSGCYPSGHTYGVAVSDFVLTAAFPEHSAQFDEMIHRVMWGRILGGVHFPTDTEAGRLLAKDVVEKMLKTPAMQQAIETIRKEAAPFLEKEKAMN